jgi:hypothetical protein
MEHEEAIIDKCIEDNNNQSINNEEIDDENSNQNAMSIGRMRSCAGFLLES